MANKQIIDYDAKTGLARDDYFLEQDNAGGLYTKTTPSQVLGLLQTSDLPTGVLKTPAAISGTLQSVEDASGNVSGLKIGTGDIEVNGLTIGRGSGGDITNIATGYNALSSNTIGTRNTAVGDSALSSNTSGRQNNAIGYNALNSNTSGNYNIAMGDIALLSNTTGNRNTAIGVEAGRYAGGGSTPNQTSSRCIYIGASTRASADGRIRETVIGEGVTGSGDDTATIGGTIVFPDMPTSSSGLPSGALWNDSGTVKIV
jgi:hypothetical protein